MTCVRPYLFNMLTDNKISLSDMFAWERADRKWVEKMSVFMNDV